MKEGKLDSRLIRPVREAQALVQRIGRNKTAAALLLRQRAISDDLFGHWLQRLSGRQIVVILDACFSGGFATQEKGVPGGQRVSFDFLDREIDRLKDIGQPETALLSACRAHEKSGFFADGTVSLFTKYLLDSVVNDARPLTLEQGFQDCRAAMHGYFKERNRQLVAVGGEPENEYVPYLVDYCRRPPLLKP